MSILVVTGSGTDVGKTIATASLASCAVPGSSVAVVKPAQTGVTAGQPGDLAEVTRLSGCTDVFEFYRYPDPLSPHQAAAVSGLPQVNSRESTERIAELDRRFETVIVEGAGGLLVPFNDDGWTLLDLAVELEASIVLVTAAGLGTINHTALTVQRIAQSAVSFAGIVIGSWPAEPGLVERCNLIDLSRLGTRPHLGQGLAGALPAGMATMRDFPQRAQAALDHTFGGTFSWPAFRDAERLGAQ